MPRVMLIHCNILISKNRALHVCTAWVLHNDVFDKLFKFWCFDTNVVHYVLANTWGGALVATPHAVAQLAQRGEVICGTCACTLRDCHCIDCFGLNVKCQMFGVNHH